MTDTPARLPPDSHRRTRRGLYGAGGAVAAWGAFALWKAFEIDQPAAYRPMGPRVFPVIISVGLIVIGLAFVAQVWRRGDEELVEHVRGELASTEPKLALGVLVLLIGYAAAFKPVGYVLSTALFLPAAARVLGSRNVLQDAVVAVLIAVVAFSVFTRLLSIDLPGGVLGDVL